LVDLESWEIIQRETIHTRLKGEYGSTTISKTVFRLDRNMNNIFDTIAQTYKLYPEDYLNSVYLPEISDNKEKKQEKEKKGYISKEHGYLVTIENKLEKQKYHIGSKYLRKCREVYYRIFDFLDSSFTRVDPADIPNKCKTSLDNLFFAYYVFQKSNDDAILPDEELIDFAINSFICEDLNQFFHEYKTLILSGTLIDRPIACSIARQYIQVMKEILPQMHDEIQLGKRFTLDPLTLTVKDLIAFKDIRKLLFRDFEIEISIEKARNDLIKYFEIRMRDLIAQCLNIQYGENWIYNRQILSKTIWSDGIQKTISSRTKNEPDFKPSENLLTYTNQTHLKDLILDNWNNCFYSIFYGIPDKNDPKKKEIELQWYKIYQKRKDVAHYDNSAGQYVIEIFILCVRMIQWLNRSVELFLTDKKAEFKKSDDFVDVYFKDPKFCTPEKLTWAEITQFWNSLKNENEKLIRFSKLPSLYKKSGRKQLAIYRFLLQQNNLSISKINVNEIKFKINSDVILK
ncbi:MAG: hypothetical protein MUO82_07285, partial [Candidatus Thermoplasmatota archaeon]|nr:hypothetical protein [Candidatus Thermoplasmatota archaeon]